MDKLDVRPITCCDRQELHRVKRQLFNHVNSRHARTELLSAGGVRNREIAQAGRAPASHLPPHWWSSPFPGGLRPGNGHVVGPVLQPENLDRVLAVSPVGSAALPAERNDGQLQSPSEGRGLGVGPGEQCEVLPYPVQCVMAESDRVPVHGAEEVCPGQ